MDANSRQGSKVLEWLYENRAWMFSGIGIFILSTIVGIVVWFFGLGKQPSSKPSENATIQGVDIRSSGESVTVIHTGDGDVSISTKDKEDINSKNISPEKKILFEGYKFLNDGNLKKAENKFNKAKMQQPESPEPWYWKARVAMSSNNKPVAIAYIDEGLELDPHHVPSLALKTKLLLLRGGGHIREAREFAGRAYGISDMLDQWIDCLKKEKVFSLLVITDDELDRKCSPLVYGWGGP